MKTTQEKAIKAYNALIQIQERGEVTSVRTGKALFDLKRALQGAYEFQLEREQEAINRVGGVIDPSTGMVSIHDDDEQRTKTIQLTTEFKEIAELETDIQFEPTTISGEENLRVNMKEIEALDGFIEFA